MHLLVTSSVPWSRSPVISIKDLYIRDFPAIKNGKQRVVLKPYGAGLPSFFQVGRYKASLFFTGRVSCCPYCEETTRLGRDCPTKHVKRCFTCGQPGHISRNCPGYGDPRLQPQQDNRRATDNNEQERMVRLCTATSKPLRGIRRHPCQ